MTAPAAALEVQGLGIAFGPPGASVLAVRDVSLCVRRGETLGLVGESGCGKSTVALALLGYLAPTARLLGGRVLLQGEDVLRADADRARALRGPGVALVQQDPVGALNPVMTLGDQLLEVLQAHRPQDRQAMRAQVLEMLARVALPDPQAFMARYPHQASGGQLQRVAIAMALLARPRLLVLDEPTTGLDVTIEAEVARLVAALARDFDMAVLYISHNLGLIRRVCDRVAIMYAGEIVEEGPAGGIFAAARHPYTRALVACLPHIAAGAPLRRMATIAGQVPRLHEAPRGCAFAPRCGFARASLCVESGAIALSPVQDGHAVRCARANDLAGAADPGSPTLERPPAGVARLVLQSVTKRYSGAGGLMARLRGAESLAPAAADRVSFDVAAGEIVALVGESGSGKSTLARVVVGLDPASAGRVLIDGHDVAQLTARKRPAAQRRAVQIVFQNPDRTLNPSHRIGRILGRALHGSGVRGADLRPAVANLLARVRLPPETAAQWPRALSGGQRQRVAIARALAAAPDLVLADEPVSALDVSVQGAIINLLLDERHAAGTSILLISHDLALVHAVADRVVVLLRGKVMETGPRDAVFSAPHHPYTRTLLAAAGAARDWPAAVAAPPAPGGCVHAAQCRQRIGPVCVQQEPPEQEIGPGHHMRCHRTAAELGREPD